MRLARGRACECGRKGNDGENNLHVHACTQYVAHTCKTEFLASCGPALARTYTYRKNHGKGSVLGEMLHA